LKHFDTVLSDVSMGPRRLPISQFRQ